MQFRLKTLLIVVTCAALAAAAMAPWFRSLDEVTQTRFAVVFGTLAVTNAVGLIAFGISDLRLRRQAGHCWKEARLPHALSFNFIGVWGVMTWWSVRLLAQDILDQSALPGGFLTILHASITPILILALWLPITVKSFNAPVALFCENGIVRGRWIPRSEICAWRWEQDRLVLLLATHYRMDIRVSADDRIGVEQALDRWQANAETLQTTPAATKS